MDEYNLKDYEPPAEAEDFDVEAANLISDEPAWDETTSEPLWSEKDERKRLLRRRLKKLAIPAGALLVVIIVAVALLRSGNGSSAQAGLSYLNHTVDTRDLTLTLSGTGSLSPADSYTVTTLVEGEILSAAFEEGDVVEKGDLLYEIDSKDAATSIEQAELSLSQSQRNYNQKLETLSDLTVKSPVDGQVLSIDVEVGDDVASTTIVATIRDSATMRVTIPFTSDDAAGFTVGQSALVTLDGTFEILSGTVAKISGADERLEGNRLVRQVSIDVENPGGISDGQAATATVNGIASSGSGTFAYRAERTVSAGTGGTVSALRVKEGDTVSKNQALVTLSSTSLSNDIANSSDSLRSSQISLQNKYQQLEDYSITSPISGTIIEKFYKQGDTLESGKTLCTIFDLSYLTMTLDVDELDVSKVSVGQAVVVTAEALEGRVYEGVVTKVNITGTTPDGVTSYPVTIRIDETDGLLPGMNVQATIVVSESKDAVAIPVSALARGNRVLVQGAEQSEMPGGAMPADSNLPVGFGYVIVSTGISDGEYIEITQGLSVGDVITYMEQAADSGGGDRQTTFVMGGGPMPSGGGGTTRVVTSEGGGAMPAGGGMRTSGGGSAMGGG